MAFPDVLRRERPVLSVVIPTLQEESLLPDCLEAVLAAGDVDEVLVVDGGSTDRTRELAAGFPGVRVLASDPGRGRQMNRGAGAARGELFWFLHADCLAPRHAGSMIRETLGRSGVVAGAFRFAVASPRVAYRGLELGVRVRSEFLGLPYGDQGLFMTREVFLAAGAFDEVPRMEDLFLVRRLARLGRIEVLPEALACSARRWEREGLVGTCFVNLASLAGALACGDRGRGCNRGDAPVVSMVEERDASH